VLACQRNRPKLKLKPMYNHKYKHSFNIKSTTNHHLTHKSKPTTNHLFLIPPNKISYSINMSPQSHPNKNQTNADQNHGMELT
jgi:hypothetical protein